ncbi:Beta-glucuronosyltransferase GlcAT14B [Dichanthelium oligosanthes]|uniref:Beta-glucuronosyltransferase GlcAT14B n=1 Tax=Dichanthelium oligosanthes TaxID=888268 RepID=A0A1E5V3A7_9POAL|nr:Beta-glucuronosyltransferase GlcAT14B [Dichanthelium oligosanthes]
MQANGRGEQHSPRSAAAKSLPPPRGGGGGEHYSAASAKTPRGGGASTKLLPGSAAWLVDSRWARSAALSLLLFLAVALAVTSFSSSSSPYVSASSFFSSSHKDHLAVEAGVHVSQQQPEAAAAATNATPAAASPPPPPPGADLPRLAYLISGSKGDLDRLWRTLHALYHPRNQYVVHLDRESPVAERLALAARVANSTVFRRAGNVHVIRRANMVTYRGPTMVANTLHACAVLLRRGGAWDWFINLSASDYPLMTQDDILHVFSTVPKNVNFIEHTGYLGWKEGQRARPLIVDPGLYGSKKQDIFWVSQKREVPTAFKLFTGSAWVALSRDFVEYTVWGWDNLPRTLLMYYANFVSSPEGYFQTLICNAPRFVPTVANHDLHHIQWDVPPRQHPHALELADLPAMLHSGAPFARKFPRDDPVLDAIDAQLLGRPRRPANNGTAGGETVAPFVPGGWCGADASCRNVDNDWVLRPGPGAERFKRLIDRIVRSEAFPNRQCK